MHQEAGVRCAVPRSYKGQCNFLGVGGGQCYLQFVEITISILNTAVVEQNTKFPQIFMVKHKIVEGTSCIGQEN